MNVVADVIQEVCPARSLMAMSSLAVRLLAYCIICARSGEVHASCLVRAGAKPPTDAVALCICLQAGGAGGAPAGGFKQGGFRK
jgi:hypothetical protein